MIRPSVWAFGLVKAGQPETDFEDACSYWPPLETYTEGSCPPFTLALADGATTTPFSKEWATLLVEGFAVQPPELQPHPFETWLAGVQSQWQQGIAWGELPWYAERKARLGAAAAFLGVCFRPEALPDRWKWQAVAMGDCCLFQVRGEGLIQRFPLTSVLDFSHSLPLLISVPPLSPEIWATIRWCEGEVRAGDTFYLMSDALAHWFFREDEKGHRPWMRFRAWKASESDAFTRWIAELRQQRKISNDDTTLVVLQWQETHEEPR